MKPTKPTKRNQVESIVVQGTCGFPIDMLRYDVCVPANSTDASTISESIFWIGSILDSNVLAVRLVMRGHNRLPSLRRWLSFGWKVVKVSLQDGVSVSVIWDGDKLVHVPDGWANIRGGYRSPSQKERKSDA